MTKRNNRSNAALRSRSTTSARWRPLVEQKSKQLNANKLKIRSALAIGAAIGAAVGIIQINAQHSAADAAFQFAFLVGNAAVGGVLFSVIAWIRNWERP